MLNNSSQSSNKVTYPLACIGSLELSLSQRLAQKALHEVLQRLPHGCLALIGLNGEVSQFGDESSDLHATMEIHHPDFYTRILLGGSIGAGESYIEKQWDSPDLTQVIRLFARNLSTLDKIEDRFRWLSGSVEKLRHWRKRNSVSQAKDNISAHYDLGNDLYQTFLDTEMLYSSALFCSEHDTLEMAQYNKMKRLCEKLELKSSDHLLEIGTGWGGLAIFAARHYGCKVTTTTISQEQHDLARERIKAAGLSDRVTLLMRDYRELYGQFDKVVSVEMIEAVGKKYLNSYAEQCQALLKPGGLLMIQAITIADQRYDSYSKNVDFIQKHVFPGGFLPSVTRLLNTFTNKTDFVIRDLIDMGQDYATTLANWHARFSQRREEIIALGYDERFIRLWRFYLCYCEGGFLEKKTSAVQVCLQRPAYVSP